MENGSLIGYDGWSMAKVGRPKLPETEKGVSVNFKFPPALLAFLDAFALEHRTSRSQALYWMVQVVKHLSEELGERFERLVAEEAAGDPALGKQLASKARDSMLREEARTSSVRDLHIPQKR